MSGWCWESCSCRGLCHTLMLLFHHRDITHWIKSLFEFTTFLFPGFRYGSDIVPFSKVDQDQMKYKHDGKCFAVLGFAKQSMVFSFFYQCAWTWPLKVFKLNKCGLNLSWLFTGCMSQVRRHQFMGNQVLKVFAGRDDEVRAQRTGCTACDSQYWWCPDCVYFYAFLTACRSGTVGRHPGAGWTQNGGHCALRLWPSLQPSDRGSVPLY